MKQPPRVRSHKEKGHQHRGVGQPLLDAHRDKDLLGTFLSDIVLQVLSFVVENECVDIHQREAEGIAAAKARGVHFGRPSRPLPEYFGSAYQRWKEKNHRYGSGKGVRMALSTFHYRAAIYGNDKLMQKGDLAGRRTFLHAKLTVRIIR